MTIAACYLSTEGVVLGADSTATFIGPPERHYNHGQKLFEIGDGSTLGIVTWGLGGLPEKSFRTLIAEFSDHLMSNSPANPQDVAVKWRDFFCPSYFSVYAAQIQRYRDLVRITSRTPAEQTELIQLSQLAGGFCIAGRVLTDRTPFAFQVAYGPDASNPPSITQIPLGTPMFWGCPNLMHRLLLGMDQATFDAILASGKWSGTPQELFNILRAGLLQSPGILPLRDAVDWVHSAILITIKAMKFSQMSPVCGGPIEIATITTDRPFRWVTHKGLDEALDNHRPRRRVTHVST